MRGDKENGFEEERVRVLVVVTRVILGEKIAGKRGKKVGVDSCQRALETVVMLMCVELKKFEFFFR